MNLTDVMAEIGDALETIPGLRVHRYPVDSVTPPAAIVQFPTMQYDAAFQRGLDRWEGGVAVLISSVWDRSAAMAIARYTDGNSDESVHAALRAHDWQTCSYARATRATFPPDGFEVSGIVYVAAQIDLDIAGPGTV